MLVTLLASYGAAHPLGEAEGDALWTNIASLRSLAGDMPLWRVNVPPSNGPAIADVATRLGARWLFDWAGGLVWIAGEIDAATLRDAAELAGGHAALVRGPAALRATIPALHPLAPGVAALEARVRRAFDPQGVFETGRF
jgi:glycolate oxidase FAD binding subunit